MKQIRCECGCAFSVPAGAEGKIRCPSCRRPVDDASAVQPGRDTPDGPPTEEDITVVLDPPASRAQGRVDHTEAMTEAPTQVSRQRDASLDTYDIADSDEHDDAVTVVTTPSTGVSRAEPAEAFDADSGVGETPAWKVAEGGAAASPAVAPGLPARLSLVWRLVYALDHTRWFVAAIAVIGALLACGVHWQEDRSLHGEGLADYYAEVEKIRETVSDDMSVKSRPVAHLSYVRALEDYRLGKEREADARLRALVTLYPKSQWGQRAGDLLAGRQPGD